MVHNAVTFSIGEELVTEADQAASRNLEFHTQIACHFGHVLQLSLTQAQAFHNSAHEVLRYIDSQCFHRLHQLTVCIAMHNNLRFTNLQLKAFTTHSFNQNRQMQLATAGNFISIGAFGLGNTHGNVGLNLFEQTVTQMTAGNKFTFTAGKRTVVNVENHRQGRFVNLDALQSFRIFAVSDSVADVSVLQTDQSNDITCFNLRHFYTLQALVGVQTADFTVTVACFVHQNDVFAVVDGTANYTAYNDTAYIIIIVQGVNQHLQRCINVNIRSRNVFQNYFEQRLQRIAFLVHGQFGNTVTGGSQNNRELQLIFICIQLNEQVQNFVNNFINTLVRAVNLVDYNNRFQVLFQCFTQYVFGLRHRAFISINQQQYAVNHGQYAFNLAAEVSMARGVQNVDFYAVVHNSGVFRQNGDTTFTFQSIGVHNTFFNALVSTENAALLQHSINQGRLAMVNVGNNCYITNIVSNHYSFSLLHKRQEKGCLSSASFHSITKLFYYMLFPSHCQ